MVESDPRKRAIGYLEVARIKFAELVTLQMNLTEKDFKRTASSIQEIALMLPKIRPTDTSDQKVVPNGDA